MLEAEKDAADFTATSPTLTGGDVDADWTRAASVPRAPDDEVRTSAETLEERDRYRWEEEE